MIDELNNPSLRVKAALHYIDQFALTPVDLDVESRLEAQLACALIDGMCQTLNAVLRDGDLDLANAVMAQLPARVLDLVPAASSPDQREISDASRTRRDRGRRQA